MKKYLIYSLFFLLVSCTTVSIFEKEDAIKTFNESKNRLLQIIKLDEKNKINDFFVYGIRNNKILEEIKKYDLKNILFLVPIKSVEVVSKDKIKSIVMINNSFDTYYFNVVWKKYENTWKIYSIYQK